jgi:hypothetical protein
MLIYLFPLLLGQNCIVVVVLCLYGTTVINIYRVYAELSVRVMGFLPSYDIFDTSFQFTHPMMFLIRHSSSKSSYSLERSTLAFF